MRLLLLALALSQGGAPPQQQPTGIQAQNGPVEPLPVFSPIARQQPGSENDQPQRQTKAEESQASSAHFALWIAGFAVLIAVGQAGMFGQQLGMMRRGLGDTRRAIRAARDSANAAQRTATIMEQTAERQLRAYIGVAPDMAVRRIKAADHTSQVLFVAKATNCGKTPAYNIATAAEAAVLDEPNPVFPSRIEAMAIGFVAPDSTPFETRPDYKLVVSHDDLLAVQANPPTKRVYFFGHIRYEDAFHKRWHLEFCFYAAFDHDPAILVAVEGRNYEKSA